MSSTNAGAAGIPHTAAVKIGAAPSAILKTVGGQPIKVVSGTGVNGVPGTPRTIVVATARPTPTTSSPSNLTRPGLSTLGTIQAITPRPVVPKTATKPTTNPMIRPQGATNSPQTSSVAKPAPKNVNEFSVRVRKIGAESNRKYNIMNLKKQVDIAKWKNLKMMREDNKKVFKANRNEDEPKFGAGSEFGKDAKEEARRKKFGIISKRYNPEDQPWLLQEDGPAGRKYKGVKEGGVTENTSYYIFQQAGSGAFEAFPIESWYGFTPTIKYNYMKEEEAEEEFSKRNKVMSRFSTMVRKRMNDDKEEDDNDDDDEGGGGKKRGKDKAGGKNKKKKNQFNLTDMDDWVEESEEEGSGDSDAEEKKKKEEEDDFTVKKKPKKGEPPKKKKKKKEDGSDDEDESEGEESDDGDFEGREEDYITDSSEGESEQEEKAADAMKGVDQREEDEDEESEDEEKKKKKEEEEKEKEKGKKSASAKDKAEGAGGEKEETFDSSSSDDSDSDSDVEKDSLLFLKKKEKKKNSSNESSRAPTPSGEGGEGSSKKRKAETDADSSTVKKMKNLVASKTNSPDSSSGSSQSPPSSVITAAEKEGLTEDAVRKYLTRKPLTTIDLLAKFKNKKSAMTQEQLVQVMAYYLRRISPVNRKINGKIFWSLSKDGAGEG